MLLNGSAMWQLLSICCLPPVCCGSLTCDIRQHIMALSTEQTFSAQGQHVSPPLHAAVSLLPPTLVTLRAHVSQGAECATLYDVKDTRTTRIHYGLHTKLPWKPKQTPHLT